ncbi:SOS response-associated peptidase [Actinoplanes sp. TBRC 11911]|uniref:SOS response-associated peptidase n=1 Tax=Actinoplanes sp. TBRC 11911 TaxID=2729386 RepID=UPI00145DCEB1|nr:SOS response-associated peptidase [Actinoplanes sp. TBRC 11911]NMO50575.1 SOS response-associated peptidase [Actinoplanes sp. TBRC 11911]
MCGRYATTRSEADLSDLFDAVNVTEGLTPSWNVAPTDPVPLVRVSQRRQERVLDAARWGLVPPWADDLRAGSRMINARSETVATSPAFAPSFAKRRCLIPADGWFEWLRDGKRKQPYYMTPEDGGVLAFAGLWSAWGPESVLTCTILTAAADGELRRVHDRMPLVLSREHWDEWLTAPDATALLTPVVPSGIELRPVGAAVGNVRNNGPELIIPEQTEATLF